MKRLVGVIVSIIVLFSIYYDLNHGTLPATAPEKSTVTTSKKTKTDSTAQPPYFEKKVAAGDTVLSILEENLNHSIPVPISEVETDFELLNNGIAPQKVQPGKVYKFPDYQDD